MLLQKCDRKSFLHGIVTSHENSIYSDQDTGSTRKYLKRKKTMLITWLHRPNDSWAKSFRSRDNAIYLAEPEWPGVLRTLETW